MAAPRVGSLDLVLAVVVAALGVAALAEPRVPRRLVPVDQAASRPDFFTFRAQLITAIARHDASALMAVVHPSIKCDFGGGEGRAYFEEYWKPSTSDSRVWAELGAVLALGGTFNAEGVTLPAGGIGYVAASLVRSPIAYRASFSRHEGRWQMVLFIAGD